MNELKQKRKELGITQIQAANACGVSRRTYQTYEETHNLNDTYNELLNKLDEMSILDGSNYISSVKCIKRVCRELFEEKYPEVECAYLFGSYARGEAKNSSDVDIYCERGDIKTLIDQGFLEEELENALGKEVDIVFIGSRMGDYFREQLEGDKIRLC